MHLIKILKLDKEVEVIIHMLRTREESLLIIGQTFDGSLCFYDDNS